MNPILLSTVLLISFLTIINCEPTDQPQKIENRNYYEYYAEAVNHYYREPRSPERAIAVLRQACRHQPDRQDVSCYNLGVLLENEKQPGQALKAYRRAFRLKKHPLYREAIQSLEAAPDDYPTPFFRAFRRMVEFCKAERPNDAVAELERLLKKPDPEGAGDLHRAIFQQPVFEDCLGENERYRELLANLPERDEDLAARSMHFQGRNSQYHTLWDMELHLLRLTRSRKSEHPVTARWQGVLRRGGGAAENLAGFMKELDRVEANAPADRKKDIQTRVLAMKRAAAILIDRDPYFGGIRGNGRVRSLINPYLKP